MDFHVIAPSGATHHIMTVVNGKVVIVPPPS
jgi:hypothetical protein